MFLKLLTGFGVMRTLLCLSTHVKLPLRVRYNFPSMSDPAPSALAPIWTASDVSDILLERTWLSVRQPLQPVSENSSNPLLDWLSRAASLLSPHSPTRESFADLLSLVFTYDARAIAASPSTHAVFTRPESRDVLRSLAPLLLNGPPVDSDRLKEIFTNLKSTLRLGGREVGHPLRLALTGRVGEGPLDRVILLIDPASELPFAVPVLTCRARLLSFLSSLD